MGPSSRSTPRPPLVNCGAALSVEAGKAGLTADLRGPPAGAAGPLRKQTSSAAGVEACVLLGATGPQKREK